MIGDKWTLLIVRDLASGPRRFVELQRVLPGISTEQLRSRLNRMVADGMLTRKRYREVPPRVDYELTERARELMPILGELARWGYEWAWGPPRSSEAIDIGAIFRLAPGIGQFPSNARGTVELTVDGACYTLTIASGKVSVAECEAAQADARAKGDQQAWVRAFSPDRDRSGLALSGDKGLVGRVLDRLALSSGHRDADSRAA